MKVVKLLWKRALFLLICASLLFLVAIHPGNPIPSGSIHQPPTESEDDDCPFRDSPLYRSVFVYPNPHEEPKLFQKLKSSNNGTTTKVEWPWILQRQRIRRDGTFLYDVDRPSLTQFSLDLVVHEILASSCLRTWDPETAKLYYVPFWPSVFRLGGDPKWTLDAVPHTSIYEQALADAMLGQSFEGWERVFGLTSRYWRRRQGTDHVVVMPEPLHGLFHPRGKRGFHHYIKTQKQLLAPIVVSVEVSTTFVETYPQCSQKNVLIPYPNIDGRWYNGDWDDQADKLRRDSGAQDERPFSLYYDAGNHGECLALRRALQINHECESQQHLLSSSTSRKCSFPLGTRLATFCPCPGGDSPSAKRMFDAVLAGCIPVILSHDFVWPFSSLVDPKDFSIRLDASRFSAPFYQKVEPTTSTNYEDPVCQRIAESKEEGLQEFLKRTVSPQEISRLQEGLKQAAQAFSYFANTNHGTNPLREGILPSGGAAQRLVEELAYRAKHGMEQWGKCQEEKGRVLEQTKGKMVKDNKC